MRDKRVFKWQITILLALLICILVLPVNTSHAGNESDFSTMEVEEGVSITRYSGTNKDVVIPDTIGGKKVVSIGNKAFKGKDISGIILPEGLTMIGDEAFQNNRLTSIVIPEGVGTLRSRGTKKDSTAIKKVYQKYGILFLARYGIR